MTPQELIISEKLQIEHFPTQIHEEDVPTHDTHLIKEANGTISLKYNHHRSLKDL